jgi:sugar/nucleoside kinase (ribokinase family)
VRIGVVGQTTLDIVMTDRGEERREGGGPLYACRSLAALGVDAVPVTHAGVVSRLDHRGDATRQWIEAVGPPFTAAEVIAAVGGCDWLILSGQTAVDFPPDLLAEVAAAGHRVCLDAQGLSRGGAAGPVRLRPFPREAVTGVAVLKLAERVALAAVGSLDDGALRALGVPEVAVTRGAAGSLVVTGSQTWTTPATGAGDYDDPTGAGDTWTAAYVVARAGGADPGEAARSAAAHTDSLYL